MKNVYLIAIATIFSLNITAQISTRFEQSKGTQTPTYAEAIDWWTKLDAASGKVKMMTMGMTDAGFPLHLIVVANNGDYNFTNIRKNNKRIILINNGIHPGEPDGIDASMLLARDIVSNKYALPDNIVLAIIPVYNIGGCLNRSANYRVDQNGPEEFGFRGNSQNLDLNRDFIKSDSKEARAFAEIFHLLDPDVFVDNHVSDGADYQHVMTLLTSQHSKMGPVLGDFMNKEFEPGMFAGMKQKGYDLIPYVNSFGDTPEAGWPAFWDSPRYSSGYGALWQTFSFMPESHMLKPYNQRVRAVYALMQCFISFTSTNSDKIRDVRDRAKKAAMNQLEFPISWTLDKTKSQDFVYKGYAAERKPSEVSGQPRLFYDRSKPYEKTIKLYNEYVPKESIRKPLAYIIPQGWWKVIDLLKLNKVNMRAFRKDTIVEVEVYRIADYKTSPRQFEMHHINSDVKTETSVQKISFRKGDWYIPMDQAANHFLIEVLEPKAEDSYFTWNYFDAILGQKEGYSGYAFEDIAAEYLKRNAAMRTKLEQRRGSDSSFAKSGAAQLNFIYQNSDWIEPAYLRYPVFRVVR